MRLRYLLCADVVLMIAMLAIGCRKPEPQLHLRHVHTQPLTSDPSVGSDDDVCPREYAVCRGTVRT